MADELVLYTNPMSRGRNQDRRAELLDQLAEGERSDQQHFPVFLRRSTFVAIVGRIENQPPLSTHPPLARPRRKCARAPGG